ncbi:hypothetical protein DFJ58DRAFT_723203 [Suillus subalutaceus]|uniref:uncharacterized protein n=1 Tax=Suillus subalutaceus TaxID=48586 RepID=UPI001B860165|nr:uncharacterized protein DFJ58DRAFT_723203 [Suillus subalutaceus]KAG1869352.1 hypothetical protein DFJ58DRAFT_723203 [Suillus subalutaceus]
MPLRFRILVIGKTGVGKSSLINRAFGVQNATASHDKPGEVSIDHEFISLQNNKFVLHDSKGFEPGEKDNLKIVRDFIDHRRKMPYLKDQLHAVWWGLRLNAFVRQADDMQGFALKYPAQAGVYLRPVWSNFSHRSARGSWETVKVPIVAVFTKYDTLLDRVERTLDKSSLKGLSKADIQELTKKNAKGKLQEVCVAPLEKFAGSDIPHVAVSTNGNHEETLARLIQTTEELVCKHVGTDASVMTSVAQRVDPGLKIKASIEITEHKLSPSVCLSEYWKTFTSSVPFKNHPNGVIALSSLLVVAYSDVAYVQYLCSPEFRGLMTNMVNELDVGPTADANQNLKFGLSMVGTIAGIASALAGPAAPIIVPIAVSVVVVKWVHEVYQQSCAALLRFMEYIIDLTLVLQTLYLLSENQELSRRAIKLAVKSYHHSPMSGGVHNRIQEYDRQLTLRKRADRDSLDQLIELLQSYSISAKEVSDLRGSLPAVDLSSDEPWDTVEKS